MKIMKHEKEDDYDFEWVPDPLHIGVIFDVLIWGSIIFDLIN